VANAFIFLGEEFPSKGGKRKNSSETSKKNKKK
jgi:hypothetical protein